MTTPGYNDIAEWYDEWVSAVPVNEDTFFTAMTPLLGDITGRRICDLACGQGRVTRHLAACGAHAIGIDLSTELLSIARRYDSGAATLVRYLCDDARYLGAVRNTVFDGVVCHMALMDIPDLRATVGSVARVIRSQGWFVFSILHPCYNPAESGEIEDDGGHIHRTISGYFDEGFWRSDQRTGPPGKVGAHHRMLSTYVNTLLDAGFAIERMIEPQATKSLAENRPIWREVPAVLIVRCRKVGRS